MVAVAAAITDPTLMAFDPVSNALYYYDDAAHQLVQILADDAGFPGSTPDVITRQDLASLNLGQVRGLTFDPATGDLYILDSAARQVVIIRPRSDGYFGGQLVANGGRISKIALTSLAAGEARAIAFNPNEN